jgi:hypothetical protein
MANRPRFELMAHRLEVPGDSKRRGDRLSEGQPGCTFAQGREAKTRRGRCVALKVHFSQLCPDVILD